MTDSSYRRKALPFLLEDFEYRCAYSMRSLHLVSDREREIDHFNPTSGNRFRNHYSNLFLSSRHCNGAKSDHWPRLADRKRGIRYLNPCKEIDYGVAILENRDTGELIGQSPSAKYHIHKLDLNAPFLVELRLERTALIRLLFSKPFLWDRSRHPESFHHLESELYLISQIVRHSILPVPPYDQAEQAFLDYIAKFPPRDSRGPSND
jgi:hypothetical protein